jgi:hypothetical protein
MITAASNQPVNSGTGQMQHLRCPLATGVPFTPEMGHKEQIYNAITRCRASLIATTKIRACRPIPDINTTL